MIKHLRVSPVQVGQSILTPAQAAVQTGEVRRDASAA
jgi:hypothetical protein